MGGIGGTRSILDNCNADAPNLSITLPSSVAPAFFTSGPLLSTAYCHRVYPFWNQTQIKAGLAYPLPAGMQIGAVIQNVPGFPITANYVATNAQIQSSLGRNLGQCGTAATCNGTASLTTIVPPYSMFTDRYNQVDLRFTKALRLHGVKIRGNVDLYNTFNGNTVARVNTRYGAAWGQPTTIQDPRLLKFGVDFEF